jgi:hypothetical protein
MKYTSVGLTGLCSVVYLACAPCAEAGHGIRVDEGFPCLSTWTQISDSAGAAAFSPGGSAGGTAVACAPKSPSNLFDTGGDNGGSPHQLNDAATVNPTYTATSGEMFQFLSGGKLTSQVVVFTLGTKNNTTEIELNGWCSGSSGGSFTWGGSTYKGGCGGATTTDFLFNSAKNLIGYVSDAGTGSIVSTTSVPLGWTATSAPEIDPASALGAFTLLAGGLAVLRGGRRTQTVSR